MRNALGLASLALMLALTACGDDIHGGPVDAAAPDAMTMPDANACPARMTGEVGGPCATNPQCAATNGLCLVGTLGPSTYPPEGFCILDNGSGTVCTTDADCGAGNVCANDLTFGPYHICLPACTCTNNACPPHQECAMAFNGDQIDKMGCVPGTAGAKDGDPCAGFYDCDEFSICNNDLEYPGGQCARAGCTVGMDSTCHGGHCINVDDPPVAGTECVDTCNSDTDCRQSEGYKCFDPGGGEPKYCRHPQVGDACTSAADCGGGVWTCMTGAAFPNGYCTTTGCATPGSSDGCSSQSVCYDDPLQTANYCVDRCRIGMAGDCRTGYQCIDTDPSPGTTTPGCVPL